MTIVNFVFTKMHAERSSGVQGKISIRNNVSIRDITKEEMDLGTKKQAVLKFHFEFTSDYDPQVGKISLSGEIIYMEDEKRLNEILKEWKKSKKINKDLMTVVLNNVLTKCNVQALIISRDINLPPPIPLPKLQQEIKP